MNTTTPTHTENSAKYEKLQNEIFLKFIKQTEDRLNSYEQRIENMVLTVGNINDLVLDITDIMYRSSSANTQLEIDAKISAALEKFELEQHSKKDNDKEPFPMLNVSIAVLFIVAAVIMVKEFLF